VTENRVQTYFIHNINLGRLNKIPLCIEDVLVGTCGLGWYGSKSNKPLSYKLMIKIYQHLPYVDTHSIMDLLGMGERQASRYNRAFRFSHEFVSRNQYMVDYEPDEWVNDEIDDILI